MTLWTHVAEISSIQTGLLPCDQSERHAKIGFVEHTDVFASSRSTQWINGGSMVERFSDSLLSAAPSFRIGVPMVAQLCHRSDLRALHCRAPHSGPEIRQSTFRRRRSKLTEQS